MRTILRGDATAIPLSDCSVDAVVTDPPYHLTSVSRNGSPRINDPQTPFGRTKLGGRGFMGKTWDGGDVGIRVETWREVLRVAKPGAHLLAFGGTRTWHRLACAIEDAGWEIRDTLMWLYGSGFPKSLDISKAIDKAAGAEREVVGSHFKAGDIRGGRMHAGSNEIGVRMEIPHTAPATSAAKQWNGWGSSLKPAWEPVILARRPLSEPTVAANVMRWGCGAINIDGGRIAVEDDQYARNCSGDRGHADNRSRDMDFAMGCGSASDLGRWPANLLLDEEAAAMLDRQSGEVKSGGDLSGKEPSRPFKNCYSEMNGRMFWDGYQDSGWASRFFYCAKANRSERNAGVEGNLHPTVKPIDLMRYLVKLVTPPNGIVLDPFAGSGSTGIAADLEGFSFIGIEREAEYVEIARRRLEWWEKHGEEAIEATRRAGIEERGQMNLFA
jgi:site-specific DNA-methyltransferase (adenine-specific)